MGATEERKNALGCRVLKIGDTDIDKACEAVSTLYAYDNESARKWKLPDLLAAPDFLKAAGIVRSVDKVTLTLQDKDGKTSVVKVGSVKNGTPISATFADDAAGSPKPKGEDPALAAIVNYRP